MMALTNPESRSSDRPNLSLVLSIFKGENFVVKGAPCKAFLTAKCCDLQADLALVSATVKLTPSNSDPEFNSQLAWSLSKKQLKDLRSNRSTIRVACMIKDDKTGKETEIGYVIMHVKDATTFSRGIDVDPTKATTFPLLGTKDPWKYMQPRVQMILHLEDSVSPIRESERPTRKPLTEDQGWEGLKAGAAVVVDPQLPLFNPAKMAETKQIVQDPSTNRYIWTVNDQHGYFQLGEEAEDDDLYIVNTTIISASYLDSLWDGRSPRKASTDGYLWQIKYIAYGCEISCEPFKLDPDKPCHTTFVGDKATARIRANGALFFQYLKEASLQFHVLRFRNSVQREPPNGDLMGLCFASLDELTDPNRKDLKLSMEVVSEWGTPRNINAIDKPEVRIMFTMQSEPNYFAHLQELNNNILMTENTRGGSSGVDAIDGISAGGTERDQLNQGIHASPEIDVEGVNNTSSVRRLLQFENREMVQGEDDILPISSSAKSSPPRKVDPREKRNQDLYSNPTSYGFSDSGDSEGCSNKENLAKLCPEPGHYKVTIELTRFWLKSQKLVTNEFALSYFHPPIGIVMEPIEFIGKPLSAEFVDIRQGFTILDGEFSKRLKIRSLSESLLNTPLTVEFSRLNPNGGKGSVFGTAMIPFGRVFLEKQGRDHVWLLEDGTDILKSANNVKIGTLFFKIQLTREPDSPVIAERKGTKPRQSSFFPPKETAGALTADKYNMRDPAKTDKVTDEMREWRKTEEEMFKRQKEAYLKLLSDEAAKRDAEREEALSKKLADLDKKEKELSRQRRHLEEKEEKIRALELEVKDRERQLSTEKESFQQITQVNRKRFEEDHKVEIEVLSRRVQGYIDEIDRHKKKVSQLEKKLETKEAEIDALIASKREQPESRLKERVALLEQENKTLKNHLREANTKKEQYKKQSLVLGQKLQEVQDERDRELKEQNENLRLHILASKEHKELRKERKAVQDISHQLKALRKETICANGHEGRGDQPDVRIPGIRVREFVQSKESEIKRLAEERTRLLQTGAYTPYDLVIKEIENKMVGLAQPE